MAYSLPTEDERKRLFRLIQQSSSWTAWADVCRYHKAFIDTVRVAFEDTQANPPAEGPLLDTSEMALLLEGYASFEAALDRLRHGDRSVFRFVGFGIRGAPYFWEAFRIVDTWLDGLPDGLNDARGMDPKARRLPLYPKIEVALKNLAQTWARVGFVLETRHTDLPAPIDMPTSADARGINCGAYIDYTTIPPAVQLPNVPYPSDYLLIGTGDPCPHYGIWEPVKVPMGKGFIGLFKQPEIPIDHEFELDGCMNYLHQGSNAPTLAFEGDGPRGEGRPTVWRLLWKDGRYLDGGLPPEERAYRFFAPDSAPTPPLPPPDRPAVKMLISGEAATDSGVWACESDIHWRVKASKGDVLPVRSDGWSVGWIFVPEA